MNGILLIMQNSVFVQGFLMLFEVFLLFYSINFYTNWSNHSFQKRKSFKISGVFFSGNETSIISSDVGHSLKKNLRNTVKKKLIPIFLASAPWKHLAIHFIEPFVFSIHLSEENEMKDEIYLHLYIHAIEH